MAFFKSKPSAVARIVRDTYKVDGSIGGWYELADEVRMFYSFTCTGCKTYLGPGRGDVHHIVPLSRGGLTKKSNLTLLCLTCHEKRHSHMRKPSAPSIKPLTLGSTKPKFGKRRP